MKNIYEKYINKEKEKIQSFLKYNACFCVNSHSH